MLKTVTNSPIKSGNQTIVDGYSDEDARVQAICSVIHIPGVISTYKAATAAQGV